LANTRDDEDDETDKNEVTATINDSLVKIDNSQVAIALRRLHHGATLRIDSPFDGRVDMCFYSSATIHRIVVVVAHVDAFVV
jgi:hypothetical protein